MLKNRMKSRLFPFQLHKKQPLRSIFTAVFLRYQVQWRNILSIIMRAKMSPSGSAGMMPLETRPHIRLDHGDAAGHFGNLETACVHRTGRRGRNGCAEHKSPVVLGPLTAHGVADTCTEEREYHLGPRRRRVEM